MSYPKDLKYSETHEWARSDANGTVTVGITDFAVQQLQDLVFIELPKPGARVEKGKRFGEIESVKAVSDLIAPICHLTLRRNSCSDRSRCNDLEQRSFDSVIDP